MSSTLFEAPPFDPSRERRKRIIIASIVVACVVVGVFAYLYRYWPEERVVGQFFTALQHKDFEKAYGIWFHDANWKQHPQQYPSYSFSDFYSDWGPGGEWGIITTFHVDTAMVPPSEHGSSGVVVQVTVNGRTKKCFIWVEKKTKTLTFSPFEIQHT